MQGLRCLWECVLVYRLNKRYKCYIARWSRPLGMHTERTEVEILFCQLEKICLALNYIDEKDLVLYTTSMILCRYACKKCGCGYVTMYTLQQVECKSLRCYLCVQFKTQGIIYK